MPRILIALFASLVTVSATIGQESPPTQAAKTLAEGRTPLRIVCIGDSITGVYYHTGGRRAYPEMLELALKQAYPRAQVQVINAGISGQTTREGLARFERDVLKHQPHLVTIMFGMNDLVRVPPAEFTANLKEMIARCRKVGAEVVLCTQNNVIENGGRPNKKLAEFTQLIRDVAKEEKLAVADCHQAYVAMEKADPMGWLLWMSDAIHPNMAGHKKFAEVIAATIAGKDVSLAKAGPPQPAIPRTLAKLKAMETIKVLAMPPYDQHIAPALQAVVPGAKVEVTPWPVADKTLAQVEQDAKKVRGLKMDLVVVAIPYAVQAPTLREFHGSFSWVLNSSLSFGKQEWDVIAIPPATERAPQGTKASEHDALSTRLIEAQDLSMIRRAANQQASSLREVIEAWLRGQLQQTP